MDENIKEVLAALDVGMEKAIRHLEQELIKIRAGKASPIMLDGLTVDYYGTPTPLNQAAAVGVADARTLTIKPWEKHMIPIIERAIIEANLGFNPQNDGELIRLNVPRLTEERRKILVKQARAEGENARIGIRGARHDANHSLKSLQKDGGVSEDLIKGAEKKVQEVTDSFNEKVSSILKTKEDEIMTV